MNIYQITGIIYIHIGMNDERERDRERGRVCLYVIVMFSILQSQFIKKGFKKTKSLITVFCYCCVYLR